MDTYTVDITSIMFIYFIYLFQSLRRNWENSEGIGFISIYALNECIEVPWMHGICDQQQQVFLFRE